jgi:3-oxoacyl-[acyl-carrier protein] reductase
VDSHPARRRTALVTGASRGIGRAIAAQLAADGYDLLLAARDVDALEDVAAQLRTDQNRVSVATANMADEAEVEALASAQLALAPHLDVLVLAAGAAMSGAIDSLPLRRLDTQLAVNLRAPFHLIQRLLPALRVAAGSSPTGAKVIAIASITGVVSETGLAGYGASKAALISLCETLSAEEGENGVSATALSPGFVDTDMTEWMRDRIDPAEMITVGDVAELTRALCRLSRYAVVPNIVLTRPGAQLWRA